MADKKKYRCPWCGKRNETEYETITVDHIDCDCGYKTEFCTRRKMVIYTRRKSDGKGTKVRYLK